MQLSRPRRKRRALAEINIVPYVDVMLVLLVIFMITAPLLTQGVQLDLPTAQAKKLAQERKRPLVVSVDKLGRYYLNLNKHNKPMTDEQVLLRVKAELARDSQRVVMVRGDQAARYGQVVAGMVLLQQAGVQRIGLVTTPSDEGR